MKRICFLIPDGTIRPSTLFGVIEVFEKANAYANENSMKPFYDINLAGHNVRQKFMNGRLAMKVNGIKEIKRPDLIIIPPIEEFDTTPKRKNKILLDWPIEQ